VGWIPNGRVQAAILYEPFWFELEWVRVNLFIVEHCPGPKAVKKLTTAQVGVAHQAFGITVVPAGSLYPLYTSSTVRTCGMARQNP